MRLNCDVFIYLDVPKLLAGTHATLYNDQRPQLTEYDTDGVLLFKSTNNVILTAGVDGIIEPKYFAKVLTKTSDILHP